MPKHELEASPAPDSVSGASGASSPASTTSKRARTATPNATTDLLLKTSALPAKIPASAVSSEDGCVQTQDGPYTKVLAMCLNDFKRSHDSMHERGNNMTILECVIVQVLRAGFTSSPYEPTKDVPKKQRVFFDENNKPLQGRAMPTMTMEGPNLVCRGYNVHPTPALKNKGRGLVTDVVGMIMPGLPMTFIVHDDTRERTIPGPEVETGLVPMGLVVLDLDMKSSVQCDNGYGITLRKINLADGARMHAYGLWQAPQLYDDRSEFRSQVISVLQQKKASTVYATDLAFIGKIVAIKEDAERSRDSGLVPLSTTNIDFDILPSNCHLRATVADPESQYANDSLLVHVDPKEFTVPHTSAEWLREYYRWCMGANVARLVVFHDEYRRGKGRENGAMSGMRALVVINHEAMFARARARSGSLQLSAAETARFAELKGRQLDEGFAAWTVHTEETSGTRYAVVLDYSKERAIKLEHGAGEDLPEAEATHHSPVCEVYAGMNPERKLWLAYLCMLPKDAADMQVLEVGICCKEARASSSMQMPRCMQDQNYMELLC